MSGSLRLLTAPENPARHDHVDLDFGAVLVRLNDPRRFGCVLWHPAGAPPHPLLAHLGVEPLGSELTGPYLKALARKRRVAVKNFIMDSHNLVGVGNIYAAEALFLAGIRPSVAAGPADLGGLDQSCCGDQASAVPRSRRGRHHPARLRQQRRQARLLQAAAQRVWPGRSALPMLRRGASEPTPRRAGDGVLPKLPAPLGMDCGRLVSAVKRAVKRA